MTETKFTGEGISYKGIGYPTTVDVDIEASDDGTSLCLYIEWPSQMSIEVKQDLERGTLKVGESFTLWLWLDDGGRKQAMVDVRISPSGEPQICTDVECIIPLNAEWPDLVED